MAFSLFCSVFLFDTQLASAREFFGLWSNQQICKGRNLLNYN